MSRSKPRAEPLVLVSRALLVLALGAASAAAQAPVVSDPTPVFLDVAGDPDRSNEELRSFTRKLLELRLASLSGVAVAPPGVQPPCEGATRTPNAPSAAQAPQPARTGPSLDFFFVVRTDVHERPSTRGGTEVLLEYTVVAWRACKSDELLDETEAVDRSSVLDSLNAMAEEVSLAMQSAVPRGQTVEIVTKTYGPRAFGIAGELTSLIRSRIEASGDLAVHSANAQGPPATYRLETTVTWPSLQRPDVRVTIQVTSREGTRSEPTTLRSLPGLLTDFYRSAADAAMRALDVTRLRGSAGGTLIGANESTARLLATARTLLCMPAKPDCPGDARGAMALLTTVAARAPNEPELPQLLARAHANLNDYPSAADQFERVLRQQVTDPNVLTEAADAFYEARRYARAVEVYQQAAARYASTGVTPDADFPIKHARTLRFLNRPDDALAVLQRAGQGAPSEALRKEISALVLDVWIAEAVGARGRGSYTDMHAALARVEAIRSDLLTPDARAEALRLRGVWHRDGSNDLAAAEASLNAALEAAPGSRAARLDRALVYFRRSLPPHNDKSAADRAAGELALLVKEGYSPADALLMDVNHARGRDTDTRDALRAVLPQRGRDMSAASNLLFLCLEYLNDITCVRESAIALEATDIGNQTMLQLTLAETSVLIGEHARGETWAARVADATDVSDVQRAIALFYRAWASFAAGRHTEGVEAVGRFKTIEPRLRTAVIGWVFGAAARALDADTRLTADQRSMLKPLLAELQRTPRTP